MGKVDARPGVAAPKNLSAQQNEDASLAAMSLRWCQTTTIHDAFRCFFPAKNLFKKIQNYCENSVSILTSVLSSRIVFRNSILERSYCTCYKLCIMQHKHKKN